MSNPEKSLVEIDNLTLSIHGTPVLHGVSMQLQAGRILGVIGESGSGKSMTAFTLMQLLPRGAIAGGSVRFDGQDILSLGEARMCALRGRDIGMVFQEPMTALNPLKTIGDQVAETILIHRKMPKREAQRLAAEALTRAELPPERFPLSRYPHELSGGQRQRVVIAMAIALRPKLLIADEPTTALDVTTQAQILDLLTRLVREDGMAMMLISHDLAVVADMADDIAIMQKGHVVEAGPAATTLRALTHPYSRALLAASDHVPDRPETPLGAPLLEVREARRSYPLPRKTLFGPKREMQAVRGVSFTLKKGESLGLVGESGCGKSTLTRAILGLEALQGGSITLAGRPVSPDHADPGTRRRMQVVFQDPYGSFNPRHRVGRLVAEPFHLSPNMPRAEREKAVAGALEAVGLQAADARRYIHEFSGGQRQRIAIARALVTRPELIVLDEAVSALDVQVRARILDLLADLSRSHGLSYLFISHDLSVVRAITDRVMVMQAGQIVEEGPTERIFTAPEHDYTRALLAAAPQLPEEIARQAIA